MGETLPACHSLPRRTGNIRKDLRVREHPVRGPYVQNLRRVVVNDVEALLSLVREGTQRRRTAATRRNSSSSRSHALLELATTRATLHLADLAGSEKAGWEGCGGRQKEGANINKSLVALSNVISALVSSETGRGRFVPYRDSALTWLLKDSFTGGANTFIIATVSPSFACYGESASTLRWTIRARQLRTTKTNCGVKVAPRAVLQAQFDHLIAELSRNFIHYVPETGKLSFDEKIWLLRSTKNDRNKDSKENMNKAQETYNIIKSTTSSLASGSSDLTSIMENSNITNVINKEMDKIFVPALERTSSGSNLKITAPPRQKIRHYKSQEVLPPDEKPFASQSYVVNTSPCQSETQVNIIKPNKNKIQNVAILHENHRAEIVESVTERLYNKLKRKEEAAVSKIESVVDKKIIEPLSELRICTNARQRLIDLSQKAKNKRKIGIPVQTQTRASVIRVKDKGTEVQTDLESYILANKRLYSVFRDVSTETVSMTPRCKEIAVGSKYDSVNYQDNTSATQTRQETRKSCFVMTDNPTKCDQDTQTPVMPPPRRKKRVLTVCNKCSSRLHMSSKAAPGPVISINISQMYSRDSDSHTSDENIAKNVSLINPKDIHNMTPDLLTNHNSCDAKVKDKLNINLTSINVKDIENSCDATKKENTHSFSDDFSDEEGHELPRVTVDTSINTNSAEIKNMILGRNINTYPYNIVLSPSKQKEYSKRTVTFKDLDINNAMNVASDSSWNWDSNITANTESILNNYEEKEFDRKYIKTLGNVYSDPSDSNNAKMNNLLWKENKSSDIYYKINPRRKRINDQFGRVYLDSESEYNFDLTCRADFNYTDSLNETNVDEIQTYTGLLGLQEVRNENFLDFNKCDKKINDYCKDLETSIHQYDDYLEKQGNDTHVQKVYKRKPKEFLQELVQLRREVVKNCDDVMDTESSYNLPRAK